MSKPTIQEPVNPLRQRMLQDMAIRGLREHTLHDYIRFVRSFAAFLRRSPDTATAEDIRRFQAYQAESGVQPPTINSSVSALRFFFTVTLDRPDLSRRLVIVRHPRKLPDVLNARGNSQSRALAVHPPVRTALTPAVGSDFAKVLSKLPPEELERPVNCSTTSAQGQCQGSSEPQPSVAPSLPPVRASMDCLIKVTVCTRPFGTDGPRTIPRGSSPSGFGRASFGVTHPGGVMMLWL